MWNPGQSIALRGVVNQRVWSALSVIVVKDLADETVLLLVPGAQCAYPEGYFRWKHGDYSGGTRWQEARSRAWTLREFVWQTNRFLIFLEPQEYFAIFAIWNHDTDQFSGYYVNFQLPYRRSHCGFDTLDLDLDMVIDPQFAWRWKDEEAYQEGIREGGILEPWAKGIENAQPQILARIHSRSYPLDGSWLHWQPVPAWNPPRLPDRWAEL